MRISDWSSDVCSSDLNTETWKTVMNHYDVDFFVIGAGSGGVRAARIAAGHGARVMIAEADRVGGPCVIRGCVHKKLMVLAGRFAVDFAAPLGFGLHLGSPRPDGQALNDAKERELTP